MASYSSCSMIPGRSNLRQRPVDPNSGRYERGRARDAYKKQINIFKTKFEASLHEHDQLDFDAKQEIRIRAKRQREICLKDYRQGLQGLSKCSFRRTYKDVFLGECDEQIEMHDSNILEYELRLTSEMDTIINNIRLLCADKSNVSKMNWFSDLAKAKFSYEYDLENQIDPLLLKFSENENTKPSKPEAEIISDIDSEVASSIGSSAYIYRPFSKRQNLYQTQEKEPVQKLNIRNLYHFKKDSTKSNNYNNEEELLADHFENRPFQPFYLEPNKRRQSREPSAFDPEWEAQSLVYSYHRPVPRYSSNYFNANLDSICPSYGYDNDQQTVTNRGEMLAGIDYEYKPIIPSYIQKNSHKDILNSSNSDRFHYENYYNDDNNDNDSKFISSDEPSDENLRNSGQFDNLELNDNYN